MNFLKTINEVRRNAMFSVTKNIGNSFANRNTNLASREEINRILICRPNHRLGNLLLITPLVQDVIDTFPNCKIDLFVKGNLAPAIFKSYENINCIIELPRKPFKNLVKYILGWISIQRTRYDLVINVVKNSSSGRLSVKFANSANKIFGDVSQDLILESREEYEHIAKCPVYIFRNYLTKLGFKINSKPIASLNLKLSTFEISQGHQLLKTVAGDNDKKTICLYTYATGDKCYPVSWWKKFYGRLKAEYPTHNIIEVLPIENVSNLTFKAPTFYSKDIREIASLIANTAVFISADNGIMHLASAAQTPTIGLFSITDKNAYGPYNCNSTGIKITSYEMNECIKVLNTILKREIIHDQIGPIADEFERAFHDVKQA
jgi:ADP-heptose:LPS heptosyltransferase